MQRSIFRSLTLHLRLPDGRGFSPCRGSKGNDSHKAKDLTQLFFLHLLEKELIKKVDQHHGRFRNYVLAVLENLLHDEHRREKSVKAGGGIDFVSINENEAEEKYRQLPAHYPDPARAFDGTWAATAIEKVTNRLKQSYAPKGRVQVFEGLKGCLTGQLEPASYPEVASKLGMTKETFETNLSRFKTAFGKLVCSVIAETVDNPADTPA